MSGSIRAEVFKIAKVRRGMYCRAEHMCPHTYYYIHLAEVYGGHQETSMREAEFWAQPGEM